MGIKLSRWIANRLPKRVVYFAMVRLFAYATSGEYKDDVASKLNAIEALRRWEKSYDKSS